MYMRNALGWSKYFDCMIVDEISLQLAFILAIFIRHHTWTYSPSLYRNMSFVLILIDAVVLVLHNSLNDVMVRGYYVEAIETIKHCFYVFAISIIFVFATQSGDAFSRIILFLTFLFHIVFGYISRLSWKKIIRRYGIVKEKKRSMLVVTASTTAEEILDRLSDESPTGYRITGVVLTDNKKEKSIGNYPVVAEIEDAADYIVREWIDSVYIDAPITDKNIIKLMDICAQMAVPTHYHVPNMSRYGVKRFSENIGGTTVLTTSINYATPVQAIMKRGFDIMAGIIGSLIALIVMAVVGPAIKRESPGPVLFRQERIGQNGKHFKMYKIRSMYMDAEERKKELMEQNRVKDGMMFKLDFDPRIIGNKILPDGTKQTGIGDLIRRYSLDEWPQFFNVLEGTMSCVGTRPPTVDEWEKYEYHHRARLATKPGITGMWQVSGRSKITNFEEVVRLDTEYITNWTPGLDLKILLKTVGVLLSRRGAM